MRVSTMSNEQTSFLIGDDARNKVPLQWLQHQPFGVRQRIPQPRSIGRPMRSVPARAPDGQSARHWVEGRRRGRHHHLQPVSLRQLQRVRWTGVSIYRRIISQVIRRRFYALPSGFCDAVSIPLLKARTQHLWSAILKLGVGISFFMSAESSQRGFHIYGKWSSESGWQRLERGFVWHSDLN